MYKMLRKAVLPTVLVLGIGGAATAIDAFEDPIPALDAQAAATTPDAAPDALSQAFRSAARSVIPAVVHVQVESAPRNVSRVPEEFRDFPFDFFFRFPDVPPVPQRGSGSGFIISSDGYVLTNNHVVEDADRVTVTLTDNRVFDAEVVGRDPSTDVAVLKIEAEDLPTVKLGNSDALEVGDWVLALGYPLSLGETVTAGIVSATGRSIGIMARNQDGRNQNPNAPSPLEHFIQTDAAINPGNSGGPLINLNGEVVGINSAIASPTGVYAGYGFAVPIQLAKRVADDLIEYGVVHRPKLGVRISDLNAADVKVFKLPSAAGVKVASEPESPAREAGVRMGDVIVAVDGVPVSDASDLMAQIARRQPGDEVTLDIIRYGDRERVKVKLGAFESTPVRRTSSRSSDGDSVGRLGFAVTELTPGLAQREGFDSPGGLIITGVEPGSSVPPALVGMRIKQINGEEIRTIEDLRAVANKIEPGDAVSVIAESPDGEAIIMNYQTR
ncbi:MAG TPA: trypsin-like peptidase domain-containing protein [Longimicrobiaceae bacterium]